MSASVLADGAVFGPFEIRCRLGKGGMGEVYRALDRRRQSEVALKVLSAQLAGDNVFLERFRREARAAFELRDPYILPVHDSGEVDGRLYITMPLVDGRDLAAVLADGPLPPARAVGILRQAAHALTAAHQAGLIHRDVKPSNLLIIEGRDDFTYLVDFGIAHVVGKHTVATSLTSTGATIGTLAYMAPERLQGSRDLDGRVDVYALTCVLFEMLTGRPPYDMTEHASLMAAHLFQPIPTVSQTRPDLPRGWDSVIARGMAKDPAERYPTAQDLADDARRILHGHSLPPPTETPNAAAPTYVPLPGGHQPPPPAAPAASIAERSRGSVVAVASSLVAIVLAATVVWLATQGVGNSSSRADTRADTATAPNTVTTSPGPPQTPATPPQAQPAPRSEQPGQPSPQLNAGSSVQPEAPADLGLSKPLTRVSCSGQYAVMVGAAVDPARYRTEVQGYLTAHPKANYLLAEQNCSSLRKKMSNGASIYSIYYGPYSTLGEACRARQIAGDDAYVRVLDNATPIGFEPPC